MLLSWPLISNLTRLRSPDGGVVSSLSRKSAVSSRIDSATTHSLRLSHMFRVLIRTPARSFRILRTEPISRSISTSTVSRFPPSIKMADSAQSTPVESLASTPAPSDTSNANVPAQQNNKKQNHIAISSPGGPPCYLVLPCNLEHTALHIASRTTNYYVLRDFCV